MALLGKKKIHIFSIILGAKEPLWSISPFFIENRQQSKLHISICV